MFGKVKKEPDAAAVKQAEKEIGKAVVKTWIVVSTVAAGAVAVAPIVPVVAGAVATVATVAAVGGAIKVAARIKAKRK